MLINIASSKLAPVIPAVTGALAVANHDLIDPVTILGVGIGLLAGALWRVGDMASNKREWHEIKRDIITSALTGLANAIIAIAITDWIDGSVLVALGVGAVTGASGTHMIKWIMTAAKDKITKQ